MSMKQDYTLVIPIEVQFRDVDAMGHLNNAVYLSYLEWARAKYWKALHQTTDFWQIGFVIARVEIDYLLPAYMYETLHVGIRVGKIGKKSFTFEYEMTAAADGESPRRVASARSVQVAYDWQRKCAIEVGDDLREKIAGMEGGRIAASGAGGLKT